MPKSVSYFMQGVFFSLLLVVPLYAWQDINGVAVCTAANSQDYPTIVSDSAGGAIITWQDLRNGNNDIYAQRVNSSGSTLWTLNGVVVCTAADDQEYPRLASDGSGGAIITWYDDRNGNFHIYAQRVDSNGNALWTPNGVAVCTSANSENYPVIVSDGLGGAIITWMDYRNGNNYDIYAQRIDSNGNALWTNNGVAICTSVNNQQYPAIVSDGSGGAIVTWTDYRNDSLHGDIYAQRMDSTGNTLWTANGVAVCTATSDQEIPSLTSDGSGGTIITWYDYRNGSTYNIYAQAVDSAGNTRWTANGVVICTVANINVLELPYLNIPTIVSDGSGGAVITWYDYRNVKYDIYAQRVDSTGSSLWTLNGVAVCTAANGQEYPTLTGDGKGDAIITWQDSRNENNDIYAQAVDSTGDTLWITNGVAICTATNTQEYPMIVGDGSGGAIITWMDERNGSQFDIYAQQVNGDGLVPVEDWFLYAEDRKRKF